MGINTTIINNNRNSPAERMTPPLKKESWSDRRFGCLREQTGSDDERDEDKEEEDDQDEPSLQNGHAFAAALI
jgi:hypothetical protein